MENESYSPYDDSNQYPVVMERHSSVSSIATEDSGYSSIFRNVNNQRCYSSKNEYLVAMIEDLSVWLEQNHSVNIGVETFLDVLENGIILCKQANLVQKAGETYFNDRNEGYEQFEQSSRTLPGRFSNRVLTLPESAPTFSSSMKKIIGTSYLKRDNVSNFISWLRKFGFSDAVMFETDDLVSHKNMRHVVLALLELARVGGLFGLSVPTLVQFEREIDAEMAAEIQGNNDGEYDDEDDEEIQTELTSTLGEQEFKQFVKRDEQSNELTDKEQAIKSDTITNSSMKSSEREEYNVKSKFKIPVIAHQKLSKNKNTVKETIFNDDFEETSTIYSEIRPKHVIQNKPYAAQCNLLSLDELVRQIVTQCTCKVQFPMTKISNGLYLFGDKNQKLFMRVLRQHVMVRVGGGWDTLPNLLHKNDPCRLNSPHPTTVISSTTPVVPTEIKRKMSVDVNSDHFLLPRNSERRMSIQPQSTSNTNFCLPQPPKEPPLPQEATPCLLPLSETSAQIPSANKTVESSTPINVPSTITGHLGSSKKMFQKNRPNKLNLTKTRSSFQKPQTPVQQTITPKKIYGNLSNGRRQSIPSINSRHDSKALLKLTSTINHIPRSQYIRVKIDSSSSSSSVKTKIPVLQLSKLSLSSKPIQPDSNSAVNNDNSKKMRSTRKPNSNSKSKKTTP